MNLRLLPCLVLLLAAPACKSKEDKVNAVCDKMHTEDTAKCAGDKSCISDADAKLEACRGLAKTVGETEKPKSLADQVGDVSADCDKGDQKACVTYGAALMLGKGVAKDEAKGVALVKKACDGGSADGCAMLARAYERGMGVPADAAKKNELMEKACTMGSGEGCRSFALTFPHADPKRIPPLEKSCELKDAIGCLGLGGAYLNGGQGVGKDLAKAKQYLQQACDLDPKMDQACEKAKTITAPAGAPAESTPETKPTPVAPKASSVAPKAKAGALAANNIAPKAAVSTQGNLDKEVIRRTIKRNIPRVQACYERALLQNPKLAGTVTTAFVISSSGDVSTATGSGLDATVASCVADVIKKIQFPKPSGGSVAVSYPFAFKPA